MPKLLYSFYKRRIPNAFGGIMFNHHRITFENGEYNSNFSKVYFFLPSITDRSEEINQYMNCVNIHPLDIDQKNFGADFNPSCLDFPGEKRLIRLKALLIYEKISNNFKRKSCQKC